MKKIQLVSNKHMSVTKGKPSVATVLLFILLAIYTIVLFVPVIWSIYASLADSETFGDVFNTYYPDLTLKLELGFDNFKFAWEELTISTTSGYTFDALGLLGNGLLYAVTSALAFTICPVIVAYATSRFKYGFSKVVYAFVVVAMSLPIVGAMASEIQMLHNLGIYDTPFALIILRFNFLLIL